MLGSRITIFYGSDRHQVRELKASGGFCSQNPQMAHFGLGKFTSVAQIEVRWSTGETLRYDGPFEAGARLEIHRSSASNEGAIGDEGTLHEAIDDLQH